MAHPAPPKSPATGSSVQPESSARLFPTALGLLLGLTLLKFGNPSVMEKWVAAPGNVYEFILGFPWPMKWGLLLLIGVAALSLPKLRTWRRNVSSWLLVLPGLWLVWLCISGLASTDPGLTRATVPQLVANCACFYLGLLVLSRYRNLWSFWIPILVAFSFVMATGWSQHFGGLEQTRKYFHLYVYPQMKEVPPEYLAKLASNRIFGTLFYPNALAGVIVLLFAPLCVLLWRADSRLTPGARLFLIVLLTVSTMACLAWSGSKGGWLLMLMVLLLAGLSGPFPARIRLAVAIFFLLAGAGGFAWRYAGFFQRGATSVSARFDYWEAALKIWQDRPLLGTGPGTFGPAYAKVKRPESEASRLVHNDYLQQASDSGLPAFLAYLAWVTLGLTTSFRRLPRQDLAHWREQRGVAAWQVCAVWMGVLGWFFQGLFEFGLYIPGGAWPAFTLLGWLCGRHRFEIDNPEPT